MTNGGQRQAGSVNSKEIINQHHARFPIWWRNGKFYHRRNRKFYQGLF